MKNKEICLHEIVLENKTSGESLYSCPFCNQELNRDSLNNDTIIVKDCLIDEDLEEQERIPLQLIEQLKKENIKNKKEEFSKRLIESQFAYVITKMKTIMGLRHIDKNDILLYLPSDERKKLIETYENRLLNEQKRALVKLNQLIFISSMEEANLLNEKEYGLNRKYPLLFKVLYENVKISWGQIYDSLLENDFMINLDYNTDPLSYDAEDGLDILDLENPITRKTKALLNDVAHTLHDVRSHFADQQGVQYGSVNKINAIDMLIQNEMYNLIGEIIINPKTSDYQVKFLIESIMKKAPNELGRILKTLPDSESQYDDYKNREGHYHNMIAERLRNALHRHDKNLNKMWSLVDFAGYGKYDSDYDKITVPVQVYLEYGLVENKEIIFSSDFNGEKRLLVSAAAVAYNRQNERLGDYLYNLPSYLEIDEETRNNSDKFILRNLTIYCNGYRLDVSDFITRENFNATLDKFKYMCDRIIEKRNKNSECFKDKEVNEIIDIYLSKTKKEDLDSLKKLIEEYKYNSNPEKKKEETKKLVTLLSTFNNALISSVPATSKVGDSIKTLHEKNK